MEQSYYRAYYQLERENWWFRVRARILMCRVRAILSNRHNPRILNVGVATGYTSELLGQLGEVQSVEYDQACYDFLRNNVPIEVIHGSILALPFEDDYYDLVCAFDVVEHVQDDQRAVQELKRVTRPGGSVAVTVPAFMKLWSRHDEVNHHYRRYTLPQLRRLFGASGKVSYASYFNFFLFFPIMLFRVVSRRISSPPLQQSDFAVANGKVTHRLLYAIFSLEYWLMKIRIRFPLGVSILMTWRKP